LSLSVVGKEPTVTFPASVYRPGAVVANVSQWHASPCRGARPSSEDGTGEIRIPLSLFHIDERQGDMPLVLSRAEAEHLHASLSRLLSRPGPGDALARFATSDEPRGAEDG
jgi:hypothetical protein